MMPEIHVVREYQPKKKTVPPPHERSRETVLVYQCPDCRVNGFMAHEGSTTCSCGSSFYVSETEGLLPLWCQ